MNMFLVVAFTIGAALAAFLGFRLTNLGIFSWMISIISIGLVLLYPFVWFASLTNEVETLLRHIIHFSMGFVSMLLGLLIIRDLIFLPLSYVYPNMGKIAYTPQGTLIVIGMTLSMLGYGYWSARRSPKVVEIKIPIQGVSAELQKMSIVQISDLHAGPGVDKEHVDRIVEQVLKLRPTVVVMTGDIADGKIERYRNTIDSFAKLSKTVPVYYVTGNHEYIKDSGAWIKRFKELGLKVLLNEHVFLDFKGKKVLFAGVKDPAVRMVDPAQRLDIAEALRGAGPSDLKILLSHQPGISQAASPFFQLQLSGHTHGGQFFPWNYAIHLFHDHSSGLKKYGKMWLYVNPGTGFWGPPIRLGTRSEITLISFVPSGP